MTIPERERTSAADERAAIARFLRRKVDYYRAGAARRPKSKGAMTAIAEILSAIAFGIEAGAHHLPLADVPAEQTEHEAQP